MTTERKRDLIANMTICLNVTSRPITTVNEIKSFGFMDCCTHHDDDWPVNKNEHSSDSFPGKKFTHFQSFNLKLKLLRTHCWVINKFLQIASLYRRKLTKRQGCAHSDIINFLFKNYSRLNLKLYPQGPRQKSTHFHGAKTKKNALIVHFSHKTN